MLKEHHCGLCIVRIQPLHFGHIYLIDRMIKECVHPMIGIGSSQESRTYGNPFTYAERKKMLENYYGDKAPIIFPIRDIFNLGKWARYAIDIAEKKIHNGNKVNIYYCGAISDGLPFAKEGLNIAMNDRKGSQTGMLKDLSATKIRNLILIGSDDWKMYVPTMNHKLIEKIYKGERPRK